jgi:hypothetical protein
MNNQHSDIPTAAMEVNGIINWLSRAECQKLFRLQQQSANSNLQSDFQRRVDAKTTLGSIIVARWPPHCIKTSAASFA